MIRKIIHQEFSQEPAGLFKGREILGSEGVENFDVVLLGCDAGVSTQKDNIEMLMLFITEN
jgi:hypothetical protein